MTRPERVPRVLIVSPVFPPAQGGIETLARHLVDDLTDCDVRVCTLAEPGAPVGVRDEDGVRVRRSANAPRGGRRALTGLGLAFLRDAAVFRPDVVVAMHCRTSPAHALYRLVRRHRWVQYFHAKEVRVWPALARTAARRADLSVAVSGYTADLVRDVGGPDTRVTVIPPGVDPGPPLRLPVGRRGPVAVCVARMADAYKGHDVLLQAWAGVVDRVPGARLVVIGDGVLRTGLEAAAADLPGVEFLGRVDDAVRDATLAAARVFVLPSRTADDGTTGEGFGIVFLEAAAAGLPTVGPREGGVVDAVDDGRTGLLVDPRDPAAVADALVRVLTDDPLADAFSQAGLAWAATFDWTLVNARVRAALDLPKNR